MSNSSVKYVTDPRGYIEPVISSDKKSCASFEAKTVITVFRETVAKHGNKNAMGLKRKPEGSDEIPSNWQIWTWQQYWDDCTKFAKTLIYLKVDTFKIVNIVGFNSPEWFISNCGAIMAGCIAAGIYSTNITEACHYISEHSMAEVVTLDSNKQLAKYAKMGSSSKLKLPHLKALVVWEELPDQKLKDECKANGFNVYSWAEFLSLGSSIEQKAIDDRLATVKPGHCSSLIYTSGTTGPPKAVMISHDNVTWTSSVIVSGYIDLNDTDRVVSFLPLSHIAAQLIDIHIPIYLGCCTYFCQPDALKGSLTKTLHDVKPTFFFGVPRVWEKIQETIVGKGRAVKGLLKVISTWAKKVGAERSAAAQYGKKPFQQPVFAFTSLLVISVITVIVMCLLTYTSVLSSLIAIDKVKLAEVSRSLSVIIPLSLYISFKSISLEEQYFYANILVLKKIKLLLGLDQCKACFTAAAPISVDTLNYFASLDIPVYEVFGQSECSGPHTVSCPGIWKIGYCGRPLLGTESMIAPGTNELCYRGRHIFMGYMYMPDKTAETIDENGYLHSGDVAEFDDDADERVARPSGFMKITGRIKELIITAGGENIPPVLIENEMKAAMNGISNCMVIGDRRKYLSMLVSLKVEPDKETGAPTDILAADALHACKEIGSTAKTVGEAAVDPLWKKYIDAGMKVANSKTTSSAQIVQKWRMLPVDFSEKAGELTPTLKLKRNVVADKYATLIDSIYADDKE